MPCCVLRLQLCASLDSMLSSQAAGHKRPWAALGTGAPSLIPHGTDIPSVQQQAVGLQIEALILSANSNLTLREIEDTFQFPLDRFQKEAVQMFLTGSSVLVCAPTGAGKTAIAEAAAVAVLSRSTSLHHQADLRALDAALCALCFAACSAVAACISVCCMQADPAYIGACMHGGCLASHACMHRVQMAAFTCGAASCVQDPRWCCESLGASRMHNNGPQSIKVFSSKP